MQLHKKLRLQKIPDRAKVSTRNQSYNKQRVTQHEEPQPELVEVPGLKPKVFTFCDQ